MNSILQCERTDGTAPLSRFAGPGGANWPSSSAKRAWRVLHACDVVKPVLGMVESQLAAGMKPSVVTAAGEAEGEEYLPSSASAPGGGLLSAWGEVRLWRRCLLDAYGAAQPRGFEVIHAHSFPSGMAAVRNFGCVVYSLREFVDERRPSGANDLSWLRRSFRVAEQFVLGRAGAIVIHSERLRSGLEQRGAAPADIFSIADPFPPETLDALASPLLPQRHAPSEIVNFFTPHLSSAESRHELLESFKLVRESHAGAHLYLPISPDAAAEVLAQAQALGVADCLHPVLAADYPAMFSLADVVILGDESPAPSSEALPHRAQAALAGAALLAADSVHLAKLPENRGTVWYARGDSRDFARRALLLAREPDLRRSLAQATRRALAEARNPEAVGRAYHRVYEHAHARRRLNGPGNLPNVNLEPVRAAS